MALRKGREQVSKGACAVAASLAALEDHGGWGPRRGLRKPSRKMRKYCKKKKTFVTKCESRKNSIPAVSNTVSSRETHASSLPKHHLRERPHV